MVLWIEFQALHGAGGIPGKVSGGAAIFGIIGQVSAQDTITFVIGDNGAGIETGGGVVRQPYPIPLIGINCAFCQIQETLVSYKYAISDISSNYIAGSGIVGRDAYRRPIAYIYATLIRR